MPARGAGAAVAGWCPGCCCRCCLCCRLGGLFTSLHSRTLIIEPKQPKTLSQLNAQFKTGLGCQERASIQVVFAMCLTGTGTGAQRGIFESGPCRKEFHFVFRVKGFLRRRQCRSLKGFRHQASPYKKAHSALPHLSPVLLSEKFHALACRRSCVGLHASCKCHTYRAEGGKVGGRHSGNTFEAAALPLPKDRSRTQSWFELWWLGTGRLSVEPRAVVLTHDIEL